MLDFQVDPSGPLATLRKLLLSDESIASFKRWVTDHWYAVLLIVFAVLFVLVSTASSRLFVIDKFFGHFRVVLAQSLQYVTVFDAINHFIKGSVIDFWIHTDKVFCKQLDVQNITLSSGFQVSTWHRDLIRLDWKLRY